MKTFSEIRKLIEAKQKNKATKEFTYKRIKVAIHEYINSKKKTVFKIVIDGDNFDEEFKTLKEAEKISKELINELKD